MGGFSILSRILNALFPPQKAMHYFGSLRHTLSRLKKDQRILRGWRKQKNYQCPLPDAAIQTGLGLWQDTTRASDAAKRRGSSSAAEGELFVCRRDRPNFYFVRQKWRRTVNAGVMKKLPALTQSFLVQRLYRQRRTDQVNSYETAIAPHAAG